MRSMEDLVTVQNHCRRYSVFKIESMLKIKLFNFAFQLIFLMHDPRSHAPDAPPPRTGDPDPPPLEPHRSTKFS